MPIEIEIFHISCRKCKHHFNGKKCLSFFLPFTSVIVVILPLSDDLLTTTRDDRTKARNWKV